MKNPILTVLIGIPGSGKSHWVKKHGKNKFIVCPDDIRRNLFNDISDQSNNIDVWNIAKGMVIAGLLLGKEVVLDATNVNTSYRIRFMEGLPKCFKQAILFHVDPKTAALRISKDIREGKNRSNVPEHIIYRMYGEFLFTEKNIKEELFDAITL